jgi:hypothetical protein
VRHRGGQQVVLEKLIVEVRALVLQREYLLLHQCFANGFDQ